MDSGAPLFVFSCVPGAAFATTLVSETGTGTTMNTYGIGHGDFLISSPYSAAYPNEILLQADVAHNNTLNNYASVQAALANQPAPQPEPSANPPADTPANSSSDASTADSSTSSSTVTDTSATDASSSANQ